MINTILCRNSNVSPVDLQKEALVQLKRKELVLIVTSTKIPQLPKLFLFSCLNITTLFSSIVEPNCPTNK